MTEPPFLEPIEPHICDEDPPDDGILLVRAGPLTAVKVPEHAIRQQRDYSNRGKAIASIGVAAAGAGWPVDRILREQLWSRSTNAATTIGTVRGAGYELLATRSRPHYDILLPSATIEAASTLLSLFGAGTTNPVRRRTTPSSTPTLFVARICSRPERVRLVPVDASLWRRVMRVSRGILADRAPGSGYP